MVYFSLNIISLPLVMNKGSFIDVIVYKDGFYLYMWFVGDYVLENINNISNLLLFDGS